MTMTEILSYDVTSSFLLDQHGAATKPMKAQLMSELTKTLDTTDFTFQKEHTLVTSIVVDIMNQIRRMPVKGHNSSEDLFTSLFNTVTNACTFNQVDYVFDSYLSSSIKNAERERRSVEPLPLTSIVPATKLPVQMDMFWASVDNKRQIQDALKQFLLEVSVSRQWETVVSGVLPESGPTPALTLQGGAISTVKLQMPIEDADLRLIPHIFHSVIQGSQRVVVLSNDSDVFVLLIHFYNYFHDNGLVELWMRKSATDIIPIPNLVEKMSPPSKVTLAIHFLTGSDVTSKTGTKASALKAQPEKYLQNFGRLLPPSAQSFELAEEYLVKSLKPNTSCKTFDKLQGEIFTQASTPNLLNFLY